MNKQDRAFTGWLNHLLMPYTSEYLRAASEGDTSAALSDLRLAARVQGAMVACYRSVWVGRGRWGCHVQARSRGPARLCKAASLALELNQQGSQQRTHLP